MLIHYLLFGYHPFSGEWTGAGESPEQTELIRNGYWYGGQNSLIRPSQTTISLDVVHPEIKRCFLQCFNDGHTAPHLRPSAQEWRNALQVALDELTVCSQVDSHYYSRNYGRCYWCERKAKLGVDIFPTSNKFSTVVKSKTVPPTTAQIVPNSSSSTKTITKSASPPLAASSTQKGVSKSWITQIHLLWWIALFPLIFSYLISILYLIPAFTKSSSLAENEHTPIPNLNNLDYHEAREKLIDAGWQPNMPNKINPDSYSLSSGNGPIFIDKGYWELQYCSGTGLAHCGFEFVDAYGNYLFVITQGQERQVYHAGVYK